MSFNSSGETQHRFYGYLPTKLSNRLDADVEAVVRGVEARPGVAAQIAATTSSQGRSVLTSYAERMSSLAVRQRSPELLARALVAAVLGGLADGKKNALMVMALIEHSATKIGADSQVLFEATAKIVGEPGGAGLASWLARDPEDRTITCMGYEESSDEDGFRYRFVL